MQRMQELKSLCAHCSGIKASVIGNTDRYKVLEPSMCLDCNGGDVWPIRQWKGTEWER